MDKAHAIAPDATTCDPQVADAAAAECVILEEIVARIPAAALLVWGAEHRIRLINGRWREAFPSDGKPLGRMLTEDAPDVASVLAPFLERVSSTGEPVRGVDIRFPSARRAADKPRFFTLSVSPVRGGAGPVDGMLVVGLETTEEVHRRDCPDQELATERAIAKVLQRSLLPNGFPELPGLTCAARYVPGAADSGVGGDWYDVFPLSGERVGIVIGDISGHGVMSASTMGQLRYSLRAYAAEGHRPSSVMEHLDRLLEPQGPIATVLYGELDLATRRLVYVSAGHPPILAAGPEGARYLPCRWHTPLGTGLTTAYEETVHQLDPDFTLILFTDGLVENHTSIVYGLERLRSAAAVCAREVEALCDHILATLTAGAGGRDDLALLVLRDRSLTRQALRVEVAARPESLERLRSALRIWLRDIGAGAEEAAELVTACGEASMNAVMHAYAITPGLVVLEARYRDGEAEITVRDRGQWRAPRRGQGGHGFALMRAMTDAVECHSDAQGTEVRLRRHLTWTRHS